MYILCMQHGVVEYCEMQFAILASENIEDINNCMNEFNTALNESFYTLYKFCEKYNPQCLEPDSVYKCRWDEAIEEIEYPKYKNGYLVLYTITLGNNNQGGK